MIAKEMGKRQAVSFRYRSGNRSGIFYVLLRQGMPDAGMFIFTA